MFEVMTLDRSFTHTHTHTSLLSPSSIIWYRWYPAAGKVIIGLVLHWSWFIDLCGLSTYRQMSRWGNDLRQIEYSYIAAMYCIILYFIEVILMQQQQHQWRLCLLSHVFILCPSVWEVRRWTHCGRAQTPRDETSTQRTTSRSTHSLFYDVTVASSGQCRAAALHAYNRQTSVSRPLFHDNPGRLAWDFNEATVTVTAAGPCAVICTSSLIAIRVSASLLNVYWSDIFVIYSYIRESGTKGQGWRAIQQCENSGVNHSGRTGQPSWGHRRSL